MSRIKISEFIYDNDLEPLVAIIIAVLILGLIIGLVVAGESISEKNYCAEMEMLNQEITFHYSFWTACLAKSENGKWIRAREYMQYYGDLHTLNIGEVGD